MARIAEEKDFRFLKDAWNICFDDPKEFTDWNFQRNFAFENTIVAEVDGECASCMQLMPHRIFLRGKEYDINYVSGVATLPQFRNRGLVREMYALAFKEMEKRKHPFSLLVPFNYPFYEKFGYKQCYEKTYAFAQEIVDEGICEISAELIEELDRIYRKEMADKNGYAVRTKGDWQRILEDLLVISKGRVVLSDNGYALITKEEKGYKLHEVFGRMPQGVLLERRSFAMARIIDAKRLLQDMAEGFFGEIKLKITDEILPQNNLTLKIGEGGVEDCSAYDFQLDIKTLAQLIFGGIEDITKSGLFSQEKNYLNMIF